MASKTPTDDRAHISQHPTLYDLARMAEDIYRDDGSDIYAASILNLPDAADQSPMDRVDFVDIDGFGAAIYRSGQVVTITYRGTQNASQDALVNDGRFETPPQFEQALQYALTAIDRYDLAPGTTCFAGHSLGGALAKYVAHNLAGKNWTAAVAASFNAPGLSVTMMEKVLVRGLRSMAGHSPVELGLQEVERLIHAKDLPQEGATLARILNINIKDDPVSQIGDTSGTIITLSAPRFVVPNDPQFAPPLDNQYLERAREVRLRLQYLHSIHTLRRLLAEHPIGTVPAVQSFSWNGPEPIRRPDPE